MCVVYHATAQSLHRERGNNVNELLRADSLAAFATLAALEIVLGIDNVVFIAILSGKLKKDLQAKARQLGLALAAAGRIILLFGVAWIITLDATTFDILGYELSIKDGILIAGGLFLLAKATWEIHHSLDAARERAERAGRGEGAQEQQAQDEVEGKGPSAADVVGATFGGVIVQILLLDLVFSIDSVLTAVGMVELDSYQSAPFPGTSIPWPPLVVMISAILVAIAVMLIFAGPLARFIEKHPTMKMLALSFLLLIGMVLVAEGLHQHIPRGYIYFAMGFSLFVEMLNLRFTKKKVPPPAKAEPAAE